MVLAGDSGFAAGTAVPSSLILRRCDGEGGQVTPLAGHTKLKDLNHPANANVACGECACNDDQSSDGITDLSLKFATNDLVAAGLIAFGDGQVTLELTGELADETPFVARDCLAVLGAGEVQTANARVGSNADSALIGVTPMDLNADTDGFGNFARAYLPGTQVTLTAPIVVDGRRFLRWSADGVLLPLGQRTIEFVAEAESTLKAFYQRPRRLIPDRPTEGDGDLE